MRPYLLIAAAAVFLGIAVWFRLSGKLRGEPAWWFFVWLVATAFTAAFTGISWWIGDRTISLSFQVVAGACLVTAAFVVFLFAHSFGHRADFTILLWSLPYQFALAGIIVNRDRMHVREGDMWVLNRNCPFVWVGYAILLLYAALAIAYILVLHRALRREGRRREARHLKTVLAAFVILVVASVAGDALVAGSWVAENIPVLEVGALLGAVVLLFAFLGPRTGEDGETEEVK